MPGPTTGYKPPVAPVLPSPQPIPTAGTAGIPVAPGRGAPGVTGGQAAHAPPLPVGVVSQNGVPVGPGAPPGATPGGQSSAGFPGGQGSFEDWLKEYIMELNKGVDFNDPRVKTLLGQSQQMALDQAKKRGINGPMAVGTGQRAYTQAAAGLMGQQGQQKLQALQMGLQNTQANARLGLDQSKFQYDIDQDAYQRQLDQWALGQNNNAGFGAGLGGVLGGAAGLAASFIPGLQPFAPGLIAGGAKLGSGIGGALGGGSTPPPPMYTGKTRV